MVISNDMSDVLKVGDRFTGIVSGNKFEFEVCGILKEPNFFMDFRTGGSRMTWDALFIEKDRTVLSYNLYKNGELVVGRYRTLGLVVKIDDSLSKEEKKHVLDKISKYGLCISFKEIGKNTDKIIKKKINKYTLNYLMLLVLGFLGIVSISLLDSIRELSMYSIWYLSGLRWRNIYVYNLLKTSIILMASGLLSFLILSTDYMYNSFLSNALVTKVHYIIAVAVLAFVLFMTNALLFIVLNKHSPIDVIRRFNKE